MRKKIRIEIWTFAFQICFQNQFSGSGQTEKTNFFLGAFWSVFKKIKNGFSIVFSKNDFDLAKVNRGDRLWVLQSF